MEMLHLMQPLMTKIKMIMSNGQFVRVHVWQELEQFLSQSLQYAMDMEYAADNNISLDFPDREESFLGARSSLNMLCIMISDHITLDGEEPPALYTNLPMFSSCCKRRCGR